MPINSFLKRLLGLDDNSAKSVAKNRLKFVIVHDRAAIPPAKMEMIRKEIFEVLSRHIDIEPGALEVSLERDEDTDTVALVANIPIRRGDHREEKSSRI